MLLAAWFPKPNDEVPVPPKPVDCVDVVAPNPVLPKPSERQQHPCHAACRSTSQNYNHEDRHDIAAGLNRLVGQEEETPCEHTCAEPSAESGSTCTTRTAEQPGTRRAGTEGACTRAERSSGTHPETRVQPD